MRASVMPGVQRHALRTISSLITPSIGCVTA
jgi:hypothetical protein